MHLKIGNIITTKAKKLIFLDKINLTPNFIILGSDFISKIFNINKKDTFNNIKTKIIKTKIDERYKRIILKELIKLSIINNKIIIRSSACLEDSPNKSFCGLFRSVVSDKNNIFNDIKKSYTFAIQLFSIAIP